MFNKNKEQIVCISSAFNESNYLEKLISKVKNYCVSTIIINDGSTDNSNEILKKQKVLFIDNKKNIGKAASLKKAYDYLRKNNTTYKYVLLIDSDLQHNPDEIPTLLEDLKKNKRDIVIGRRDLRSKEMPFVRKMWNIFISYWLWLLFRINLKDSQSGFRLLSFGSFEKIFNNINESGYLFETEMDVMMAKCTLNYSEVGISTIYQKEKLVRDSNFLLFLRTVRILFYTIRITVKTIFIKYKKPITYSLLVVVMMIFFIDFYNKQEPTSNLLNKISYAKKYVEATNWIKKNTPKEAIFLTEWTEGHQVVLLADRRVVVTSKVYPSEAEEIFGRYSDLGKFFYSNNESIIKNVLNKHDASYIFIRKKFNYSSSCKGIKTCDEKNSFLKALISGNVDKYIFIKKVYINSEIRIYKYEK